MTNHEPNSARTHTSLLAGLVSLGTGCSLVGYGPVQRTAQLHPALPAAGLEPRSCKALTDGSLLYHTGVTLLEIVLGLLAGVSLRNDSRISRREIAFPGKSAVAVSRRQPGRSLVAIAPLLVIWLGDRDSLEGGDLCIDRVLPGAGQYDGGRARGAQPRCMT